MSTKLTDAAGSASSGDLPLAGADGRPWPSLREAIGVWLRIALLSFGGPAGQIAVMHRILVEEKRWLGESRFLHALNFCMLLPGPEAQQLAVYIGWLMHRVVGGMIAGILFVLPGLLAIMLLSWVYVIFGDVDVVVWLFFGLKAAVLAIVLNAVVRIGKRALSNATMLIIALLSFIAIFCFSTPFPLIILLAGLIGYVGGYFGLSGFQSDPGHGQTDGVRIDDAMTILGKGLLPHTTDEGARRMPRVLVVLAVAWLLPTALLWLALGSNHVFTDIAVFFSKMAVVTFGGAYAVLAYVAQAAVDTHGWLRPGEMLDGLGMAETTPGPLIMVTQFVGFMGAFRDSGAMSPLLAGTLGGLLTTWVTFVPCFLWIFLGASYVERLRDNVALSAALTAITAAVVGVILNLALWFSLHVLFGELGTWSPWGMTIIAPVLSSIDVAALVLSLAALLAVFRFQVGTAVLLMGISLAGVGLGLMSLIG